jgi:hypothetical protein
MDGWVGGLVGGWVDGWMDNNHLRLGYSVDSEWKYSAELVYVYRLYERFIILILELGTSCWEL